nr:hypothetical protein CFP56_32467 [Quercus suber]
MQSAQMHDMTTPENAEVSHVCERNTSQCCAPQQTTYNANTPVAKDLGRWKAASGWTLSPSERGTCTSTRARYTNHKKASESACTHSSSTALMRDAGIEKDAGAVEATNAVRSIDVITLLHELLRRHLQVAGHHASMIFPDESSANTLCSPMSNTALKDVMTLWLQDLLYWLSVASDRSVFITSQRNSPPLAWSGAPICFAPALKISESIEDMSSLLLLLHAYRRRLFSKIVSTATASVGAVGIHDRKNVCGKLGAKMCSVGKSTCRVYGRAEFGGCRKG